MYKKTHFERIFFCNCCLKTFSSYLKLTQHQQFHIGNKHFGFDRYDGIDLSQSLTLNIPRKVFYSRDKQLKCFLCCKQFRVISEKNNHMNTHFNVKFQPEENAEIFLVLKVFVYFLYFLTTVSFQMIVFVTTCTKLIATQEAF